jgi:kojibiose phosphorylase
MQLSDKSWLIEQNQFALSGHMETCYTLANGYMGIRGTHEEAFAEEHLGTYVAGIYDKSEAQVTQLVNLPYFFGLKLYIDGTYLNLQACEILDYYRALDMKQGLLYKSLRVKDQAGRVTSIRGYRFVSRSNRHLAGIHYVVTPENYAGLLTIDSTIDGTTLNDKTNPRQRIKHYTVRVNAPLPSQGIYLEVATRDQDYRIGLASVLRVEKNQANAAMARRRQAFGETAMESVDVEVRKQEPIAIQKFVAVITSRDVAKEQLQAQTAELLDAFTAKGMEAELAASVNAFTELWNISDIQIQGDQEAEQALRFNIFHLMNCANPEDERVSIGAKGIHGEGYKGHVFWDTEIFMLPFFVYTQPKAARSLLMYRYHLLDAARENARMNGYRGAQYPWESADRGKEETPKWGFDYKGNPVRIWTGDIEYHITADIAYAVWQYYRATDDIDFFLNYGVEMFLETARFWSSRGEYNAALDRYEINQVIGPDEFHEHVNNNLYTNYLAKWNLTKSFEILDWLKREYPAVHSRIVSKIGLTDEELGKWQHVADHLYVPIHSENGLLEQHEGYFQLKDYVITEYDENLMPKWPDGVDITKLNDYTVIKQADVIMLLHLLGEDFSLETKKRNFEYYEKRTMHKSSLSPSIYCLMGLTVGDHSKAYEYLMRTAKVDLVDNQGNTAEGLHSASTGGTWQAAVFGFGGMHVDKDGVIGFAPTWIPTHWQSFQFRVYWKGTLLEVQITQESITVTMLEGEREIPFTLFHERLSLRKGQSQTRTLKNVLV